MRTILSTLILILLTSSVQGGTPKLRPQALENLDCLSEALYFEARGENKHGQIAVGIVVLNRVKSDKYPNSVCEVIHQQFNGVCQFSYYCDGRPEIYKELKTYNEIRELAWDVLQGEYSLQIPNALYFHASYMKPYWIDEFTRVAMIGNHHFYSGEKK